MSRSGNHVAKLATPALIPSLPKRTTSPSAFTEYSNAYPFHRLPTSISSRWTCGRSSSRAVAGDHVACILSAEGDSSSAAAIAKLKRGRILAIEVLWKAT